MFGRQLATCSMVFALFVFGGCLPTLDPIGDQAVDEGGTLSFTVTASAPAGTGIPSLGASNLPAGASFTDHGDGSGTFEYNAPTGHSLVFEDVTFNASTAQGSDTETIHIFVDDVDSGGLRVRFYDQGKAGQHGVAFDSAGDLYLGDYANDNVIKVSGGTESVFAWISGGTPSGLVFDTAGDLFVSATNGTGLSRGVWKVEPDGTKSRFSDIPNPWELDFDSSGNLFATTHGGYIYVIAPDSTPAVVVSGYTLPFGVAVDSGDSVFFTEHTLGNIYRIDDPLDVTPQVTLFAGGLTNPEGLAIDASDNLYVADTTDGIVYRYDPSAVKTVLASGMSFPVCMAFGPGGHLYLACAGTSGRVYVLTENP